MSFWDEDAVGRLWGSWRSYELCAVTCPDRSQAANFPSAVLETVYLPRSLYLVYTKHNVRDILSPSSALRFPLGIDLSSFPSNPCPPSHTF